MPDRLIVDPIDFDVESKAHHQRLSTHPSHYTAMGSRSCLKRDGSAPPAKKPTRSQEGSMRGSDLLEAHQALQHASPEKRLMRAQEAFFNDGRFRSPQPTSPCLNCPQPASGSPMKRARVVTLNAALGPLDYRVPEGMAVQPGSIVVAPVGPRQLLGVAWEADRLQSNEVPDARLRPL